MRRYILEIVIDGKFVYHFVYPGVWDIPYPGVWDILWKSGKEGTIK